MTGPRVRGEMSPKLTPSERQVVRLLVSGMNRKQIAAKLGLSPRTIEAHVRNARERTGTGSQFDLAVMAARGAIDVD